MRERKKGAEGRRGERKKSRREGEKRNERVCVWMRIGVRISKRTVRKITVNERWN